jgi:hypothetical protein
MTNILSLINTGLSELPVTQNSELYKELVPIYGAIQSISSYLTNSMGAGVPQNGTAPSNFSITLDKLTSLYPIATEVMVPGTLVNFTVFEGKLAVRKATASGANASEAQACTLPGLPILVGEVCKVTLLGLVQVTYETSPFAPGQFLYLGTSPNGMFEPNPANIATATVRQRVGFTLDAFTDRDNNKWQNVWFNPNLIG